MSHNPSKPFRVYRQDHTGRGIVDSEHALPSEAIKAAITGKREAKPSVIRANIWYVAFPLEGARFDLWYA